MITVINASAAVTLPEQRPEKNSGYERDSNPRPLRCRCSALSSLLYLGQVKTSPYKGLTVNDRSHVALIAQLGEHCTGIAEVVGLNPAHSLNFFQVSVQVVLRPHLH